MTTVATDDGLVLLDERGGRYWQLNTTAAAILEHLARGSDPARRRSIWCPVTASTRSRRKPTSAPSSAAPLLGLLASTPDDRAAG
ncbi:PqqD family peptide modification chaperone [Streptomyces nogalater]